MIVKCSGKHEHCCVKKKLIKYCKFKYPFEYDHWDAELFGTPKPPTALFLRCFKKYGCMAQIVNVEINPSQTCTIYLIVTEKNIKCI